jgi:hypothetical protein
MIFYEAKHINKKKKAGENHMLPAASSLHRHFH